jgi:protein tyrosine phosphatase (PTP) superfamily phosphohydrolase (DUF442 family)
MKITKERARRIAGLAARTAVALAIPILVFIAWDQSTFNFGVVQPGRIYRSGQMPRAVLARTLREQGIKTVLNLRGSNSRDAWYRDEVAATNAAGATQVDVAMSSCLWMSRDQLRALVRVLDQAEYPLLVHCSWGSERTGLVSAFAELLRPGGSLSDARAQFSLRYLFVAVNDGKVMALHLEQYASWLRASGLKHDPPSFRRWVDQGFKPGVPSREQWPYDPYHLVVITRPGSQPEYEPAMESLGPTRLRK